MCWRSFRCLRYPIQWHFAFNICIVLLPKKEIVDASIPCLYRVLIHVLMLRACSFYNLVFLLMVTYKIIEYCATCFLRAFRGPNERKKNSISFSKMKFSVRQKQREKNEQISNCLTRITQISDNTTT